MKNHPDYSITPTGEIYNTKTGSKLSVFNRHKYLAVALGSRRKNQKIYYLHRLLAEEYLPNPNGYPIVNHKDGNKLNNDLSNLEWASYSQNNKHSFAIGKNVIRRGMKSPFRKLTIDQVNQIKEILAKKELSQCKIAKMFGVSRGCILGIYTRKTWSEDGHS